MHIKSHFFGHNLLFFTRRFLCQVNFRVTRSNELYLSFGMAICFISNYFLNISCWYSNSGSNSLCHNIRKLPLWSAWLKLGVDLWLGLYVSLAGTIWGNFQQWACCIFNKHSLLHNCVKSMFVLYEKEEACFIFILDVVYPHPASVVLVLALLSLARKQAFILVKSQKLTTNASNVLIVQISVGWICWIADVVQLCKILNHYANNLFFYSCSLVPGLISAHKSLDFRKNVFMAVKTTLRALT